MVLRVRGTGPRVAARAGQAVAAVAVVGLPLTAWGNLATTIEMGGRLEELRTACDAIPDGRVVYLRYQSPPYLQTLTTVCGVEGVEFREPPTADQLAAVRRAWGGTPLTLVAFRGDVIPWGDDPAPALTTKVTSWPSRLSGVPTDPAETESRMWIGVIQEDGTVVSAG